MRFLQSPGGNNDDDNYVDGYPSGTLKEHRPDSNQIRERYGHQIRQTHGFEFHDFPGPVVPTVLIMNVNEYPDFGLMMKLANRAIQEYNEKEHNVCPLSNVALCDYKSPSPRLSFLYYSFFAEHGFFYK